VKRYFGYASNLKRLRALSIRRVEMSREVLCALLVLVAVSGCNPLSSTSESKVEDAFRPGLNEGPSPTPTALPSAVAANSTITGSGPVTANGVASSTITITLRDVANQPVAGETPTFTATDTGSTNVYGACTATNALGVSTCTLKATRAETKTLSIATPVSKSDGTVVFQAGAAAKLSFSTQPSATGDADTALAQQPVVQVLDANNNFVSSATDAVTLTAYSDTTCTTSVASGISATTNPLNASSGTATFAIVKVLKTNAIRIGAAATGLTAACSNAITISAGAPSATHSTIAASAGSPAGDGVESATVTITLKDANQNVIPSTTVQFASTGTGNTLTQPAAQTDSSGQAAGSMVSTVVAVKTLSISAPAGLSAVTTTVTFMDKVPSAITSTVAAYAASLIADGATTATVTVTVKNAAGEALTGKAVTLTSSRGATDTLTGPTPATTNASGQTTFTVKSSTVGLSSLTAAVPAESITLLQKGKVSFLTVSPLTEFQAQAPDGFFMSALTAIGTVWKNLTSSAVTNDATLTNYTNNALSAYATTVLKDGPIAYWRMSEPNTSYGIRDSVGSYHGTYVGAGSTLGVTGPFTYDTNTAWTGAGAAYASFTTPVRNTPPYTACAWVKPASATPGANGYVFANGGETGLSYGFSLVQVLTTGVWRAGFYSTTHGIFIDGPASTTNWTHICLSWDGTTTADAAKLYVNGVVTTGTAVANVRPNSPNNFRIGLPSAGASYQFIGSLDEIAIYDKVVSATSINAQHAARQSSFAGGGVANDPNGLTFDGSSLQANLGTGNNGNTSFSFDTWVKPYDSSLNGKVIFSNGAVTNAGASNESNAGLTLKQSNDNTRKLELDLGTKTYVDEVMADAPLGYWRLGESSGNVAYDSTTNGRNGTYTNSPTLAQTHDGVWGTNDKAVQFNGTNQYVSIPAFTGTTSVTDFTVEAWVKVIAHNALNRNYILDFRGNGAAATNSFAMLVDNVAGVTEVHHVIQYAAGVYTEYDVPISSAVGNWTHHVVTRSGSTLTAYVNGVAIANTFTGASVAPKADVLQLDNAKRIGTWAAAPANGNYWLNGLVDEVAVYNTALSAARVQAHYNAALKRLTCETDNVFLSGTWQHLAGAFDATTETLKLWLNGIPFCSKSLTGAVFTGSGTPLKLGVDSSGTNTWSGAVGELRTYSSALTDSQVQAQFSTTSARYPAGDVLPFITGLKVWLKANAIRASDGSAIPRWLDSSGNNIHAYQNTSAQRPVYRTAANGINGRPALSFTSASNHFLSLPLTSADGDKTFFFVVKPTTISGTHSYFFDSETGRLVLAQIAWTGASNKAGFYAPATWVETAAGTTAAQVVTFTFASGTGTLYRNGVSLGSGAVATTAIDARTVLGGIHTASGSYNGLMSEVLIYEGTMSTANRQAIESYLNAKYGLY
jgi:hypothetical protein